MPNPDVCQAALTTAESPWAGRTLILDTNVLLNDPSAIHHYPGARIVISEHVLEEIYAKKDDPRLARASREFAKDLLALMEASPDPKEVSLDNGSVLRLDTGSYADKLKSTGLNRRIKVNELIGLALDLKAAGEVLIISDDVNLRTKSLLHGISSLPFQVNFDATTRERRAQLPEVRITDAEMEEFLRSGQAPVPAEPRLLPNDFVQFSSPGTEPSARTVGRYVHVKGDPSGGRIRRLPDFGAMPDLQGFAPRNLEQAMALDVLIDPDVHIVVLDAKAGAGKTFLSVLAGHFVLKKNNYRRVMLTRPSVWMSESGPGFLPGTLDEKDRPWLEPFLDNLNAIRSGRGSGGKHRGGEILTLPSGWELLSFHFVRGRSIPDSLILFDEVQNASLHHVKSVLTRLAEGSKIVVMGDPSQIDDEKGYLNASNNGLTVAGIQLRNSSLGLDKLMRTARVTLFESVRSEASEISAEAFDKPLPR